MCSFFVILFPVASQGMAGNGSGWHGDGMEMAWRWHGDGMVGCPE